MTPEEIERERLEAEHRPEPTFEELYLGTWPTHTEEEFDAREQARWERFQAMLLPPWRHSTFLEAMRKDLERKEQG